MGFYNFFKHLIPCNAINGELSEHLSTSRSTGRAWNTYRNMPPHTPLCLAPFVSLRFERYGRVFACCHNNSFLAGTYPQNNLNDIWNGSRLHDLRKLFQKNIFHKGCYQCAQAIKANHFSRAGALLFDNYEAHPQFPRMLDFKTDNTCNLACIMCFSFSSCHKDENLQKHNNAFDVFNDTFIKELEPFIPYLQEVRFSGGEPFLSGFYAKLWQRIIELNPDCLLTVQTNGNILNDAIKSLMNKGKFSVNVSLDSLNADTYKEIRINGSMDRVLQNISFFSAYCNEKRTPFKITVCPLRHNISEIPDLLRFCNTFNARAWFSTVWYPLRFALWTLPAGVLNYHIQKLKQHQLPENTEIEAYNKSLLRNLIAHMEQWAADAMERSNQPRFNAHKYLINIQNTVDDYFNGLNHLSSEQISQARNKFSKKMDIILNQLNESDIPEGAIFSLFNANNPAMFVEVIDAEPVEYTIENIKSISRT